MVRRLVPRWRRVDLGGQVRSVMKPFGEALLGPLQDSLASTDPGLGDLLQRVVDLLPGDAAISACRDLFRTLQKTAQISRGSGVEMQKVMDGQVPEVSIDSPVADALVSIQDLLGDSHPPSPKDLLSPLGSLTTSLSHGKSVPLLLAIDRCGRLLGIGGSPRRLWTSAINHRAIGPPLRAPTAMAAISGRSSFRAGIGTHRRSLRSRIRGK